VQPTGERRSYLLVDGAQLVPSTPVDVDALDVDYLSFSFHKILAPLGVGVLYAKEHLLESSRPFLYGGDMIAEGQVFPDRVAYNDLPWKFGAGHAQHPRHGYDGYDRYVGDGERVPAARGPYLTYPAYPTYLPYLLVTMPL
jgi:Aminotransferase class-V